MVFVKKSSEGGAPSLDILAARVRIEEAKFYPEPYEVEGKNETFMADPCLNLKLKVVKNLVEPGVDEDVVFYDRFKLKELKAGDWVVAKYSKLGNFVILYEGDDWFDDDRELDIQGMEGFEFVAHVKPKTDRNNKRIAGTTIDWESMRSVGGADEQDKNGALQAHAARQKKKGAVQVLAESRAEGRDLTPEEEAEMKAALGE